MTPDDEDESRQFAEDRQHFDDSAHVIADKAKLWTNARRQHVVRQVLAAPNRELSLRELALTLRDHIDQHSNQDPDYDHVRQTLRRRHLPRLAEHDVVRFEDNTIRPGPEFETAIGLLVRSDPRI